MFRGIEVRRAAVGEGVDVHDLPASVAGGRGRGHRGGSRRVARASPDSISAAPVAPGGRDELRHAAHRQLTHLLDAGGGGGGSGRGGGGRSSCRGLKLLLWLRVIETEPSQGLAKLLLWLLLLLIHEEG